MLFPRLFGWRNSLKLSQISGAVKILGSRAISWSLARTLDRPWPPLTALDPGMEPLIQQIHGNWSTKTRELIAGWWARATPLKNDGLRQLGWGNSQLNGKIKNGNQLPPTSWWVQFADVNQVEICHCDQPIGAGAAESLVQYKIPLLEPATGSNCCVQSWALTSATQRNSWFNHEKWWFPIVTYKRLRDGNHQLECCGYCSYGSMDMANLGHAATFQTIKTLIFESGRSPEKVKSCCFTSCWHYKLVFFPNMSFLQLKGRTSTMFPRIVSGGPPFRGWICESTWHQFVQNGVLPKSNSPSSSSPSWIGFEMGGQSPKSYDTPKIFACLPSCDVVLGHCIARSQPQQEPLTIALVQQIYVCQTQG